MEELPKRKTNRLKGYDYSRDGAYFITICAKDKLELFGRIVGAVVNRPSYIELTEIGKVVDNEIGVMQNIRKNICVERYMIMPNHVHMILVVNRPPYTVGLTVFLFIRLMLII